MSDGTNTCRNCRGPLSEGIMPDEGLCENWRCELFYEAKAQPFAPTVVAVSPVEEEDEDPLIAKLRRVTSGPKGNRPDYIAMLSTADATEILRRLTSSPAPRGRVGR